MGEKGSVNVSLEVIEDFGTLLKAMAADAERAKENMAPAFSYFKQDGVLEGEVADEFAGAVQAIEKDIARITELVTDIHKFTAGLADAYGVILGRKVTKLADARKVMAKTLAKTQELAR